MWLRGRGVAIVVKHGEHVYHALIQLLFCLSHILKKQQMEGVTELHVWLWSISPSLTSASWGKTLTPSPPECSHHIFHSVLAVMRHRLWGRGGWWREREKRGREGGERGRKGSKDERRRYLGVNVFTRSVHHRVFQSKTAPPREGLPWPWASELLTYAGGG